MAEVPNPPDCVTLLTAPLFHVAGLDRLLGQVIVGGACVTLPAFQPRQAARTLAREAVSDMVLVPSMLQMPLDTEGCFDPRHLPRLRRILWGAAPIALPLLERALAAFPAVEFVHAYGMTETAAAAAVSVLRIARGPMVMQGYWNRPEDKRQALRGGWLHTGDGGRLDPRGHLYAIDRLKDLIISGGENVYPAEVEAVLSRHPAVSMCAVIGVPHAKWGEAVHAAVVLRPGAQASPEELSAHCRGRIGGYKCPKSFEFRDRLPLTAAGKVLKTELRQSHAGARASGGGAIPT